MNPISNFITLLVALFTPVEQQQYKQPKARTWEENEESLRQLKQRPYQQRQYQRKNIPSKPSPMN